MNSDKGYIEHEIRALDEKWNRALASKDSTGLSAILTEDFIMIDFYGDELTKSQYLEIIQAPTYSFRSDSKVDKVHVYGNTAILTGFNDVEQVDNERRHSSTRYRYFNVFIKQVDYWQCVASHAVRMVNNR